MTVRLFKKIIQEEPNKIYDKLFHKPYKPYENGWEAFGDLLNAAGFIAFPVIACAVYLGCSAIVGAVGVFCYSFKALWDVSSYLYHSACGEDAKASNDYKNLSDDGLGIVDSVKVAALMACSLIVNDVSSVISIFTRTFATLDEFERTNQATESMQP